QRHGTINNIVIQRAAVGICHDEINNIFLGTVIVQRQDVRMLQAGNGLGFQLKTLDKVFIQAWVRWQYFYSNLTVYRFLITEVNGRHTAVTMRIDNLTVAQRVSDV